MTKTADLISYADPKNSESTSYADPKNSESTYAIRYFGRLLYSLSHH